MFEFEVIQDLKPNDEILEIIKTYGYTVKNGKIKHLKTTNLQFIEPFVNVNKEMHKILNLVMYNFVHY